MADVENALAILPLVASTLEHYNDATKTYQ